MNSAIVDAIAKVPAPVGAPEGDERWKTWYEKCLDVVGNDRRFDAETDLTDKVGEVCFAIMELRLSSDRLDDAAKKRGLPVLPHPVTNSNGKRIHPTDAGVRAFWRWFGDSAVVDDRGRPLVMYHGTPRPGFSEFKGGFFSSEPTRAAAYIEDYRMPDGDIPVGGVYPVYLKISRPGVLHEHASTSYLPLGSDGAIGEGRYGAGGVPNTVAIVNSPTQVKSAIGNRGTFDPSDPVLTNPHDGSRFYRHERGDLTLTIDPSATYNGVDGVEWVLHRGAKEVGTGLALKARIGGKWVYQIAGAKLDPDLQGRRLYPDWILPAIRSAAGAPLRSGSNRSGGAERAWSRAKGAEMVEGDDPRGYEHDWQINPPRPMTYAAAHAWERQAAERGVSTVARSARGFMRAYQRAGSFARLSPWWKRRREGFIARHMAQAMRGEALWERVRGRWRPTRRALALICWAYMPPRRPAGARP